MRQMQRLFLLSIIFLLVIPVFAQTDLDETYEWEDEGVTVDYPDDWDVEEDGDFTRFLSDETDFTIYFENYDPDDDLEEYVEDAFEDFRFDDSVRFDDDDFFIDDLDDFDEVGYYYYSDEFDNEEFEAGIIVIPLNDDLLAIAFIIPITDDEIEELDIVLDILATLTVTGDGSSDGEVYEFDNGFEIVIEDDWEEDGGIFSNGELDVEFFFFDVDDDRADTRSESVREIFAQNSSQDYDEDNITFIELDNDTDAIAYLYEEDFATIIIAFSPDDDVVVVAVATPSDEDDGDLVFDNAEDFYVFIESMD